MNHTWAIENENGLFYSGHSYDDVTDIVTRHWSESIDDAIFFTHPAAVWEMICIDDTKARIKKIPYELIP
jgi:hypothetical protein